MVISPEAYAEYYRQWDAKANEIWQSETRSDWKADVWYSHDRNRIVRELIGDRWKGLSILATGTGTGVAQWVDNELLDNLGAARVVKTNLVPGPGIDRTCDACDLPYEDETFDAVCCREVIEHVIDDYALVYEARRVLKPYGWFLITTPNAFNCLPDGTNHLRGYSPQNFIDLMEHYKFKVVEKKGNLPNVMRALIPLAKQGHHDILEEFQKLAVLWDKVEDSYYFGGELYLLCQKGVSK